MGGMTDTSATDGYKCCLMQFCCGHSPISFSPPGRTVKDDGVGRTSFGKGALATLSYHVEIHYDQQKIESVWPNKGLACDLKS